MTAKEKKDKFGRWIVDEFYDRYLLSCPRPGCDFIIRASQETDVYYYCPKCGKKNMKEIKK